MGYPYFWKHPCVHQPFLPTKPIGRFWIKRHHIPRRHGTFGPKRSLPFCTVALKNLATSDRTGSLRPPPSSSFRVEPGNFYEENLGWNPEISKRMITTRIGWNPSVTSAECVDRQVSKPSCRILLEILFLLQLCVEEGTGWARNTGVVHVYARSGREGLGERVEGYQWRDLMCQETTGHFNSVLKRCINHFHVWRWIPYMFPLMCEYSIRRVCEHCPYIQGMLHAWYIGIENKEHPTRMSNIV